MAADANIFDLVSAAHTEGRRQEERLPREKAKKWDCGWTAFLLQLINSYNAWVSHALTTYSCSRASSYRCVLELRFIHLDVLWLFWREPRDRLLLVGRPPVSKVHNKQDTPDKRAKCTRSWAVTPGTWQCLYPRRVVTYITLQDSAVIFPSLSGKKKTTYQDIYADGKMTFLSLLTAYSESLLRTYKLTLCRFSFLKCAHMHQLALFFIIVFYVWEYFACVVQ